MRGTYQYAPLKMIIAKITKNKEIDPTSQTPEVESIAFVEGDYMQYQHAHVELPGLNTGEYLIFVKAEWTVLNPLRKLIVNIYAPDPLEVKRVSITDFPFSIYARMDSYLDSRL